MFGVGPDRLAFFDLHRSATRCSPGPGAYHGGQVLRNQVKEASVRGKQILMTAAIALAVVVGFKVYEAKKG